jgi:hypothetical protein
MAHIVLLGDSIFDNAVYVGSAPDVITQLREAIPANWQATLKAVDGSCVRDVYGQLTTIPRDVTHLVLSIGGNNALGHINILQTRVNSASEVFQQMADIAETFEQEYQTLLQKILSLGIPTTVCTIYNPNYSEDIYQRLAKTALTIFNDAIIRQAIQTGLPLIDLRLTCNHPDDYANPIEPSAQGGKKIVATILQVMNHHNFQANQTQIFY